VPPSRAQRRLRDILEAVRKIRRYVDGMDLQAFIGDERTVDAVLRNLTVIGEAAGHLPEDFLARHPDLPVAEMKGMRNVVVHEYFGVSVTILWETVEHDLPPLIPVLESYLEAETR